jgi:hypothetical protein
VWISRGHYAVVASLASGSSPSRSVFMRPGSMPSA